MKLTYRPEIDGLRAIAVFAVILYHAKINILGHQPFKGGFIGVDIFFVISGYLITSIILKELISTGSFSFKQFYERRIRRILPALLFVMLVSLPFAWIYLLPTSYVDFSKSIIYSLGFTSNFYFHYSGQEYGAVSGLLKPFLHTWSLAVEEQFYILFPIGLLIIFKYFKNYLIHILILGFIISLVLADWTSKNYPSTSFYFLHTRIWELLAGSILSYIEIKKGHRSNHQILNFILPSIGLFLIIFTIIFFKFHFPHPSLYSLPAILGTCFIIWFSNPNEIITKLLSTKLFVGIGLISYSLYLWHYPIFAFVRIVEGVSLPNKIFWIILSIILSTVSYFLIERPFRKKDSFKKIFSIIIIFIFVIFFVCINIILNKGFEKRFYFDQSYYLSKNRYQEERDKFINSYDFEDFDKGKKNILIIGNSYAEDLFLVLSQTNLQKDNYFYLGYPKKNIPNNLTRFITPKRLYFFLTKEKPEIPLENDSFANQYKNADLIIIKQKLTSKKEVDVIENLIKLIGTDKKIVIFNTSGETQRKSGYLFNLLDAFVFKNNRMPNNDELKVIEENFYNQLFKKRIIDINNKLKKVAKENNIPFFYEHISRCDLTKRRCSVLTPKKDKIYIDHEHLSVPGALFFSSKIVPHFLKIK